MEEVNEKKLYVGNLDYAMTSEQLAEVFAKVGTVVDAVVITDRRTGRSKGFGFVEMATAEEAAEAIKLNGTEIGGRVINVDYARPKREEI